MVWILINLEKGRSKEVQEEYRWRLNLSFEVDVKSPLSQQNTYTLGCKQNDPGETVHSREKKPVEKSQISNKVSPLWTWEGGTTHCRQWPSCSSYATGSWPCQTCCYSRKHLQIEDHTVRHQNDFVWKCWECLKKNIDDMPQVKKDILTLMATG